MNLGYLCVSALSVSKTKQSKECAMIALLFVSCLLEKEIPNGLGTMLTDGFFCNRVKTMQ